MQMNTRLGSSNCKLPKMFHALIMYLNLIYGISMRPHCILCVAESLFIYCYL